MLKGISTTRLAEICGVSQGTVDRALNNRKGINEETKRKILQVAEEYGYRPNIHARAIKSGKSMLIGVVVFDLNNQYFSDIITKIQECCGQKGYSIIVMFTDKDPQKEKECIENLYHMSVDGIVICPINRGEAFENYLLSLKIPVVTIGNSLKDVPYVGIDNAFAMIEATEHVIRKGYDKLIYVKPPLGENNAFAQDERLSAFLKTVTDHKKEYAVTDMLSAMIHIDISRKNAIVCPTDIYALKLYSIAMQQKVGVMGFDNIHLIDELNLRLDSVGYDVVSAAKKITDHIIDGKEITGFISHKIIKRGSIS